MNLVLAGLLFICIVLALYGVALAVLWYATGDRDDETDPVVDPPRVPSPGRPVVGEVVPRAGTLNRTDRVSRPKYFVAHQPPDQRARGVQSASAQTQGFVMVDQLTASERLRLVRRRR